MGMQEVEKAIDSLSTFKTWANAKFDENDLLKINNVIMDIAESKEKAAGGSSAVSYEVIYRQYDDREEFYSITMLDKAGNKIWSYS